MIIATIALTVLSFPSADEWKGRYEIIDSDIWHAAVRLTPVGAKYKVKGFWGSDYVDATTLLGVYDPSGNQFVGKQLFREGGSNRVTGYWSRNRKRLILTSDSRDALVTIELAKVSGR